MPGEDLLPIKILLPQRDFQIRDIGGGGRKMFGEVTDQVRQVLDEQLGGLEDSFREEFQTRPQVPSVAKVRLKEDALAKSHRPDRILSQETCPIIGVGAFGELFIGVTQRGLTSLRRTIRTDPSRRAAANISSVEDFAPVTVEDRLGISTRDEVASITQRIERDGILKVELFDHHDPEINARVLNDFRRWLTSIGAELTRSTRYAPSLVIHEVASRGDQVEELVRHSGIRSAGVVPRYTALRERSIPVTDATLPVLDPPDHQQSYPVVGVIDSGASSSCAPLAPWITANEQYVAAAESNPEHGTFVAGIIAFGSNINPLPGLDVGDPCLIVDVPALPNGDPAHGIVGRLTEPDLVAILQEVIPQYRDRVRIWNISLGSDGACDDNSFSDLAKALDSIQRENDVQFVVAAGNLNGPPFRPWPPPEGGGDHDRICPPADSVCSFTVGSLAHAQDLGSVVAINEPSPFTRRGPGPAFVVKPEVVSYGGNCDPAGEYRSTGIRSLDSASALVEDIGTSFATPFAAALLANVEAAIERRPSLDLVRALVVHSADVDSLDWQQNSHDDIKYVGFGRPSSLEGVLFATQSSATVIFEDELEPGLHLELDHFPYPACLIRGGKYTGTIKMTLAYAPPLDGNYGLEYCRANVAASLGVLRLNTTTGELSFKGEVPPEPKVQARAYEKDLVKFGFKWCPTKSYKRHFRRGIQAERWQLRVGLLHRHDQEPLPQRFALVITFSGQDGQPVYDDLVQELRSFHTQDLQLRTAVRQRIQTASRSP